MTRKNRKKHIVILKSSIFYFLFRLNIYLLEFFHRYLQGVCFSFQLHHDRGTHPVRNISRQVHLNYGQESKNQNLRHTDACALEKIKLGIHWCNFLIPIPISQLDMSGGIFHRSMGFILLVHLAQTPQRTFRKGRPLFKQLERWQDGHSGRHI